MAEVKNAGKPIGFYAVSICAVKTGSVHISTGFANLDKAACEKKYLQEAKNKWPAADGYVGHAVHVLDIGYDAGKAIVGEMFGREDFKTEVGPILKPVIDKHLGEPAKKKRKR